MQKKYLEVGKIISTHGVHGEVKIQPWADSPDFIKSFKTLYIDGKAMNVLSTKLHKGYVITLFEGINDINTAMCLINKTVFINRDDASLPSGSFFLQDIYGLSVFTAEGEQIGTVADILILPAGNVYVVKGKREYLIPAVSDFVKEIDIANERMTVELIEGM